MENQNTLQLHECFLPLTFTSTEAQTTDGYKNAFPVSTQRDLKQKEGSLGQSVVGDDGETLKPNTSMKDDF